MAKFGERYDKISFPCNSSVTNRWVEWCVIFRDDRGYDVVVQHASHF
jgi:hypothetical protein